MPGWMVVRPDQGAHAVADSGADRELDGLSALANDVLMHFDSVYSDSGLSPSWMAKVCVYIYIYICVCV